MKKFLGLAEQVFTVASILHYSGGPLTVILSGGSNEGEVESFDNSFVLLLLLLNYAITFCLLIVHRQQTLYLLKKDKYIVVLIGLAVLSYFWAVEPAKTLNRAIALIGTTLFGLYLASRYTVKQQLKLLGWAFGIAVVLSFMFVIGLPKYGIMGGNHAGSWRGIYNHKNVLGKIMAPNVIIFLLLANCYKKYRWLFWSVSCLSIILVLFSTSKNSLLNVVALLAAFAFFKTLRWRSKLMPFALIGITSAAASLQLGLLANAETLLNSIGKDATLTGRTDLWSVVWEMIWKKPWLGYGYGGFWNGLDSEWSAYVWYAVAWKVPNAHNGLLDLWLNLGLVGVTIFLLGFLVITLPRALAWVRLSKTADGFWPIIFLTYIVVANLNETTLAIQNDIFWVLYVAVAFSVLVPPERQQDLDLNTP